MQTEDARWSRTSDVLAAGRCLRAFRTPLGAYWVTAAVGWKEKVVLPVQSPDVHFLSATILATIVPEIMVSIPLRVICLLTENRDNIKGGVLKDV